MAVREGTRTGYSMGQPVFRRIILCFLMAGSLTAFLALIPHLMWSQERGSLSWFKSAFDEDTYAERALRGESRPDRALSTAVLRGTLSFFQGKLPLSMIAMDVGCAFLIGGLAALLALALCAWWHWSIVIWILLLFGQELLSTGNSAVWSPNYALWNWFDHSAWRVLVPMYSTSYFTAFRSPEPQVAWCVLFASVLIFVRYLLPNMGAWRAWHIFGAILISVIAFTVYAFVGFVIISLIIFTFLIACFRRQFKEAAVLVGGLFLGTAVYAGLSSFDSVLSAGKVTFASRTPSLSIGTMLSLATLIFIFINRRRLDFRDAKIALGSFLVLLPLILMNQQVLSGVMISTRDFEINVNFALLAIGSSLLWLNNKTEVRLRTKISAAIGCIIILSMITLRQIDVFHAWRNHNEVAAAFANLLKDEVLNRSKDPGSEMKIMIADQFDAGSLTKLNLQQQFPEVRFDFLGYFNDIQDRHIENLAFENDVPKGRAQHQERFFEYLARTGVSSETFSKRLEDELSEKVGIFYSVFFFSISDVWFPHTDRRSLRIEWVRSQFPQIIAEYEKYRASLRIQVEVQREHQSAYVLTAKELPAELRGEIGAVEVARRSLRTQTSPVFLYRQQFRQLL